MTREAMKILIAVDGSGYSMAAVEAAARLPWPAGSAARIISVAEFPMPVGPWMTPVPLGDANEWSTALDERCQENVTRALARFSELTEGKIEATTKTYQGDPKAALLDEAEHWGADLLFLGTHGYNALERLWLGSVSRAVAAHAPCSVQVVRHRAGHDGDKMKILLGVDGSEFGDAAVAEVASRPWPRHTEVRVVSALHLPFTPSPETWALPDSYYARLERDSRAQADDALGKALARLQQNNQHRDQPLQLTTATLIGHPEPALIDEAREWGADLIVIGSHGHRGLTRFLLGSVSQAVAAHAPCSVEIVRRKG